MSLDLKTMETIQREKQKTVSAEKLPLNAEGTDIGEEKRYSFDFPVNAVKVDPLR